MLTSLRSAANNEDPTVDPATTPQDDMVTPSDCEKYNRSQMLTVAKIAEMAERFDDVAKVPLSCYYCCDQGGFEH